MAMEAPAVKMPKVGPRLQACLDRGSAVNLFAFLKSWDKQALAELMVELAKFSDQTDEELDRVHMALAFDPSTFFSKKASQVLDETIAEKKMQLMIVLSEVASVALYYMDQK